MKTLAEITLCKARSGRYQDAPENRRLHRVGQQYGGQKTKEDELKEFAYTIKQAPDERHFEEMSDAELKRFRVFAYKCSIDFENLNKLTRQRCKQWADIADTEIGSRNREGRKKEDSTEVAAKNKVKTEISSKREKYNKMLAGLDQFISKLEDRFEKLSESSNDEIADEAMDIVDAIYEWRDHYGSGDALTINDSEDEYFESDAREAVEDFIEIVSNEFSNKVKFDPKAFFNKFGLQWSNNVEKSRSGVYINNAENRAKHRVGQHYGSEKEAVAGADDATYPGVPDASPKNKREERLQRLENYKKAKATLEEWLQSDKMSEEVKAQMRVKLEKINQRIPALEKRLGVTTESVATPPPATPSPSPSPSSPNDAPIDAATLALFKKYATGTNSGGGVNEELRQKFVQTFVPKEVLAINGNTSKEELQAMVNKYLDDNKNFSATNISGVSSEYLEREFTHLIGELGSKRGARQKLKDALIRHYVAMAKAGFMKQLKDKFLEHFNSAEGVAQRQEVVAAINTIKENIVAAENNAQQTLEGMVGAVKDVSTPIKVDVTRDRAVIAVGDATIRINNEKKLYWALKEGEPPYNIEVEMDGMRFTPEDNSALDAMRINVALFGDTQATEKIRSLFSEMTAVTEANAIAYDGLKDKYPQLVWNDWLVYDDKLIDRYL